MLLFQLDQSRRIDRTLEMQMQLSLWEGDDKVAGLGAHTSDCRFQTADLRTLQRCTPYFPIGNPDNHSPVRSSVGLHAQGENQAPEAEPESAAKLASAEGLSEATEPRESRHRPELAGSHCSGSGSGTVAWRESGNSSVVGLPED